jgi:hypothetical protein
MRIVSILKRSALDHVRRFEEIFHSGRLRALKDLYFSFRFPQELERVWHTSSWGRSDKWPFDNIGCFNNESLATGFMRSRRVPKIFFIVYKHPMHTLLKHTRSLLNYSFAIHASHHHATNPSHFMSWICNQVNEPDQVLKTFRTIRAADCKSVCIEYLREGVSIQLYALRSNLLMHICFLLRKA